MRNKFFGIYVRIKRIMIFVLTKFNFTSIWNQQKFNVSILGNQYGKGYYIPGLLNEQSIIYSFGIGEDISFDLELIKCHDSKVYGFDPTPKSIDWVKLNNDIPSNFSFFQYGLSVKSGQKRFYLPIDGEVSASLTKDLGGGYIDCHFMSFEDILQMTGHAYIDLVKIDIEGEEYNILEDWLERKYLPPVGQIWIEFHPNRYSGFNNFKTTQFVSRLEEISLTKAKSTIIKRTNHYLLVNQNFINSK